MKRWAISIMKVKEYIGYIEAETEQEAVAKVDDLFIAGCDLNDEHSSIVAKPDGDDGLKEYVAHISV